MFKQGKQYFFFRLPERKRYQKERAPSALPGLLQPSDRLKDRNSLRSNSLSFFTPVEPLPLYVPTVRPEIPAEDNQWLIINFQLNIRSVCHPALDAGSTGL